MNRYFSGRDRPDWRWNFVELRVREPWGQSVWSWQPESRDRKKEAQSLLEACLYESFSDGPESARQAYEAYLAMPNSKAARDWVRFRGAVKALQARNRDNAVLAHFNPDGSIDFSDLWLHKLVPIICRPAMWVSCMANGKGLSGYRLLVAEAREAGWPV